MKDRMNDQLADLLSRTMHEHTTEGRPASRLVDAAHTANRRRQVRVRAAGATGVLALGGAVGVGLQALQPTSTRTLGTASTGSTAAAPQGVEAGPAIVHVTVTAAAPGAQTTAESWFDPADGRLATALGEGSSEGVAIVDGSPREALLHPGSRTYALGDAPTGVDESVQWAVPGAVQDGLDRGALTETTTAGGDDRTFTAQTQGAVFTLTTKADLTLVTEHVQADGKVGDYSYDALPRTAANVARAHLTIPDGWTREIAPTYVDVPSPAAIG